VDEIAPPLAITFRLGIRRRDYLLHELYCPEDGCDCRRVMLKVCDAQTGRTIATVSHGFDVPEERDADLGQTFLDPMNEQTRRAPKILGMVSGLVEEPVVMARFERHYALVKSAVANPDERLRALLEDNPDPLRAIIPGPAFPRRTSPPAVADVASLRTAGRSLSRNVRKAIVARGAAVIPELLAIVADPEVWQADDEVEGFVVAHALTLLAELGASEAIGVALEQLEDEEIDDSLWDLALEALAGFGAAALEPLVALYDRHLESGEAEQTFDRRLGICKGLARLRVRDDRIWARLSTIFMEDPPVLAALLSTYGDRRARALLSETLDQWEVDPSMPAHNLAIEAMAESLESLRGTLTASQVAKRKRVRRLGRRKAGSSNKKPHAELEMPSADVKLTRNGPCWCGSGKKYKRCHAKSDESVDVKMSDALLQVADPITDDVEDDPDRLRAAMIVAAAAWNCAVMERSDGQDHVLDFMKGMGKGVGPEDVDGMEEVLRMLVARKQAFFPDDDRMVGNVTVLETESGLRVQAASGRPRPNSGAASDPGSAPADRQTP